jgi:Ca2+-binding RTX toxin-like protein
VDGGLGNDLLTGGPGGDLFLFSTKLNKKSNVDTVTDFSVLDDTIVLDNAIFKKLKKEGALGGKFFFEGKKAHDGNDAIIYNAKDGKLAYDKNGDDSGGVKTFAILSAGLDLSKDDFLVV